MAGEYQWVVFTSARTVERFVPLLRDARSFGTAQIAAIGPGTAEALGRCCLTPDLLPDEYVAESLVACFPSGAGRILLPRAAGARDVLPHGLHAKGWTVDAVDAYQAAPEQPSEQLLASAASADAITFTSSSTVTNYLASAGRDSVPAVVVCIGPVTAETAQRAGLTVDAVAPVHTLEGLVDAVVAVLKARD